MDSKPAATETAGQVPEAGQWWRGFARTDVIVAGIILAGAVVIPVVFRSSGSDAYALTKAVVLRVVVVLAMVPVLIWVAQEGIGRLLRWGPIDIAVATFVGLNLLALVFSDDLNRSFYGEEIQYQGVLSLLLYVVSFYLARIAFPEIRRVRALFGAVAIGGAVVAGYAMLQYVDLDPVFTEVDFGPGAQRVFSSIGEANALGAYFVLAIPVTLALLVRSRLFLRILVGAAAIGMGIALLMTLSRGAYLGLIVAGIVFIAAVLWSRAVQARLIVGGVVGLLIVVVVAVLAIPPLNSAWDRAWERALTLQTIEEAGEARFDLWRVGLRIAGENPLLGTGQEMFPEIFDEYSVLVLDEDRAALFAEYRVESPHNVPIATAAGAGFPALAAYLAVIGWVFVLGFRSLRRRRRMVVKVALAGLLAAMAGHFVTDLFMTADITGSWLFWVYMGVVLALTPGTLMGASEAPAPPPPPPPPSEPPPPEATAG